MLLHLSRDTDMGTRLFLLLVFLSVSFIAAWWGAVVGRQAREASVKPLPAVEVIAGLAVAKADLNMGEVWEEKEVAWRLPIRNQTGTSIAIRNFGTDCGCTLVEPRSLTIPAGTTATLNLTFDLTHRLLQDMGQERRPFAISLHPILARGRPRGPGWQVHGTVKSRVTLDTLAVDFGERPVHGKPSVARKVLAAVHVPVESIEVKLNSAIATALVARRKGSGAQFEIAIKPNPDLSPGTVLTQAEINVRTPTGERLRGATLPVSGHMQPEVRVLPARVLLEGKAIGESAEAIITLQGEEPKVDHIETDSPGLLVEPVEIATSLKGRTYRVRQKVEKLGDQTSIARFVLRKRDQTLVTMQVEVCYRGERAKTDRSLTTTRKQP
jgi:hypothetical protein